MSWRADAIRKLAEDLGGVPPAGGQAAAIDSGDRRRIEAEVARWVRGRKRPVLVVTDATRALPKGVAAACRAGLAGMPATVVIATGLHRAPTPQEWQTVPQLAELAGWGVEVADSGGQTDPAYLPLRDGVKTGWHRAVVESDGIIVAGAAELHQYAGLSGGVKGVVVGCAAPETIGWIHRPVLLKHPRVRVGRWQDNPFRDQLVSLAKGLPPIFEVQVVGEEQGRWSVHTGESPAGWHSAITAARTFEPADEAPAALVTVLGSKGDSLYQASRGVTQLVLRSESPLPVGAPVVLLTTASEGLGQGKGERAFGEALRMGRQGLLALLDAADEDTRCSGGMQRAFIVAMATARHPIGYVSLRESPELSDFGWTYLESAGAVRGMLGEDYLRVNDPMHRLPVRRQ